MNTNKLQAWIDGYKHHRNFFAEHASGWDKIVIDALEKIKKHVDEDGVFNDSVFMVDNHEFEVCQIKQKFGFLDIIVYPWDETIFSIVEKAREKSLYTCENCGSSKGTRLSVSGWLVTRCDPCKILLDTKGDRRVEQF